MDVSRSPCGHEIVGLYIIKQMQFNLLKTIKLGVFMLLFVDVIYM